MAIAMKNQTSPKETQIIINSNRRQNGLDWAEASWKRWIYVVCWWWLYPILKIGYKRKLTDDDLFDVSFKDECKQLVGRLEAVWEKHSNEQTWKVVFRTFWKEALSAGLIFVPYTGAKIAQPLFLKQVVLAINDAKIDAYIGYLYALGLAFSTLLQALMHHQFFFRSTRVGAHIRIALSTAIYKRLLSLSTVSLAKTTTGQLINLLANDVGKFEDLNTYGHHVWVAPIEAIIIFGVVWSEIGIPTLFGYAILLLLGPLQTFFSRKFSIYRKNTIRWTDKRVKVINEILVGCQIVKMYRWEEAMEDVVYESRNNEFKSIRKASRLRAINMGISFSTLGLVSLATFGGSYLMGRQLVPATIFMVLSLFNSIRFPLTLALPYGIEKAIETLIASQRIDQFMHLSKTNMQQMLKEKDSMINNKSSTSGSILFDRASFTWDISTAPTLLNLNLNIKSGSLVCIMGTIGAGKSSLLSAILNEMSINEGTREVNGKVAYTSQNAWIFSGSIRENILFHKDYDEGKYWNVIKACCLLDDLRTFPAGDSTIIGEKGVNLSGGQKARISLARAVYTEADIYLFDDPLAAVDSQVAQSIFKECISDEGILRGKTRLLVTHQLQFLSRCHHGILLEHGKIEQQGTFDELVSIDKVSGFYEKQSKQANEMYHQSKNTDNTNDQEVENKKLKTDMNSIIKEEVSIGGGVSGEVWLKLFTAGHGYFGLALIILFIIMGELTYHMANKWLSIWSSKSKEGQRQIHYPYTFLGLVCGTLVFALIRADMFFHLILRGASSLHNKMFRGVLYSSLRFYESNPVGRILNRFSKDQQVVDESLPLAFFDAVQSLTMVLGSIVIIGIANPWVLFILVIIIPSFVWLRYFFLKSSREIKRLESITRSPVYALFSSSLSGLTTIRAFQVQELFINSFIDKMNANSRVFFVFIGGNRWFGFYLDIMTCCLTAFTALLSVALRNSIDSSSVALGLSYCIGLTASFQWGVRQSAETENFMTSAERINEYGRVPPEDDFHKGKSDAPRDWPTEGKIEFKNFKLKYRPELDPVIKGLNLNIEPKDKIGIIGRTGAGKSSIFQALFRLTENSTTEGEILIDGVNIHEISLDILRKNINSIPQSAVLFSNTLRYNLDPFKKHTDEELWDALQAVQLKNKIIQLKEQLDTEIAEYGSNFSVGECQLICVARAILKPSKILLIDEATAHVDPKTDELIQRILREKFADQTILTIAHRLNTVADNDKIVVMADGIVAQYGPPKNIIINDHQSEIRNSEDDLRTLI